MTAHRDSDRHTCWGWRARSPWSLTAAVVLMLTLLLLMPASLQAQGRPFELEGLQGGTLGPADFAQGVTIVIVWASWSPHCRDIAARVESIVETWGSQSRVLMVNFQEDAADARAFLAGKTTKAPVYLDRSGAFSKAHSVTNLPGLVILKDGAAAFSGKLSRNPDSIISQTLN